MEAFALGLKVYSKAKDRSYFPFLSSHFQRNFKLRSKVEITFVRPLIFENLPSIVDFIVEYVPF